MKICLIGPTYPFRGGISHYTTLLYKQLKLRHEVTFLSFKRQYPKILFPGKTDIDPSKEFLREENVLPILDSMNPFTWLKSGLQICRVQPDLVILPWWVSFWAPQYWTILSLIKLFGHSKILFLCHNVVEHESKWIDKILTRLVLSKGELFIVHSTEDRQTLLNMLPGARVSQGVHPTYDFFASGADTSDAIRKKYKIQGHVVLFFGFVREYKGLKYLIKALPEVHSEIDVTLLIVGEFWTDKDEYLRLIKELGLDESIIVVDEYIPNEDVGLYFRVADLVVQPYISATGSGIIQIAFGFNKPAIATKVGSLSDVVEHGKTGYLVEPGSSHELAKAIIEFFREKQGPVFSENIRKENHKFSWERMVELIEDLASSPNTL